jgi:hypothetical protein
MSSVNVNLTPEQQELLDSGLLMLAHMIAETHLRRTALRKQNESTTQSPEMAEPTKRKIRVKSSDEKLSEDHDE